MQQVPHVRPGVDVLQVGASTRPASNELRFSVKEHSPFYLPRDWEAFGVRCGCSHASMRREIVARAIGALLSGGVRCFEIFVQQNGAREKIGQAAILTRFRRHIFLDRLAIPPEFDDLWIDGMRHLLNRVGAGHYIYTATIGDEPNRADDVASLPGATIDEVQPLIVQSVYFKNWVSWDEYHRGLSTNSKRNYKRAIGAIDRLNIVTKRGLASLSELWFLCKCSRKVAVAKKLGFPLRPFTLEFVRKAMLLGDRHFVSVVRSGSKRLSVISGVEFGSKLFYLHGGRGDDRRGAAWYLMIESLREFSQRHPDGVYMMGAVDYAARDEAAWSGLLRSRAACQVTDVRTSVFTFRFDPLVG